ncbi:Peptidyl-prolyl cis-trans isomerase [Chionoecetes opilio]|uniref:Peptidyl-prolyl cis-trans isomerase n=1 Tax=Chionoecetes opilio TaxID=41210 RepID=A0A8J5BVL8_CHIOP|nr:Peptidyl-prolyl cis-trans isomerase [Chionoecetes opilio]
MADPTECKVCFIGYSSGGEQRPRTFPCGHTFCSSCITSMLRDRGSHLTCPTCRVLHSAHDATHFPINYGMEALIQQMKQLVEQQGAPESQQEKGKEIGSEFEKLKERTISLLLKSSTVKAELLQHQEQLMTAQTQHTSLVTRICDIVTEHRAAMSQLMPPLSRCSDLADEGQSSMCHLSGLLEQLESVVSPQQRAAAINNANRRIYEVEKWIKRSEEANADTKALKSSTQVLEATQASLTSLAAEGVGGHEAAHSGDGAALRHMPAVMERVQRCLERSSPQPGTLTMEELRGLSLEVRRPLEAGLVFGVLQEGTEDCRSARLSWDDGRLHLYHMLDQRPPLQAHTVQVTGYLSTPHSSLLVFLDLAWGRQIRGRVYIRLYLDTPLARQFLLLCSGSRGHTYAGTSLLKVCGQHSPGEFIMGGDYSCDDGSGGLPLLQDLHGNYRKTGVAGSVWGRWEVGDMRAAQFAITTRDCQGFIPRVFGCVEEGLGLVRAAIRLMKAERVTVHECGVVVNL